MEFIEKRQLAKKYLTQDKYSSAVSLYEQCIEAAPEEVSNYWELGIALLLAGKEAEAQAMWLQVIIHGTPEESEANTIELINLLSNEGKERLELGKYQQAERIYWQMLELNQDNSVAYNNLGVALLSQGKLEEAIACYQQAVNIDPNNLEAQNLWFSVMAQATPKQIEEWTGELNKVLEIKGQEFLKLEKYEEAEIIYGQIIERDSNNLEAYKKLGNACFNQNKLEKAVGCYQKTIKLNPNYALGYCNIGAVFMRQGKIEAAIAYLQHSLELNQDNSVAYNNLGVALLSQGKQEEAIACYQQAVNIDPNNYEATHNLGSALQKQDKLEDAIKCYQQCLVLKPNDTITYNHLGGVLQNQGKLEEAIACYQQSLLIEPNQPIVVNDLGTIFYVQGKIEEAIFYYQQSFKLDSKYAIAYNNLGVVLLNKGHLDRALFYFNRTLEIDPDNRDAHRNLGLILLQQGNYKSGFASFDWWVNPSSPPRTHFSQPLWNGSNLSSSTILFHLDFVIIGFGDTIQFIRYIPLVAQRVGFVVVECQEPLVRLLTTVPGIHQVVAFGAPLPPFDVQAPLMSLPRILETTLETVPAQIPYLTPPKSDIIIKVPPNTRLKVGIVWASGYHGEKFIKSYKEKSCSLPMFIELLEIPGISLYSLQVGCDANELSSYLHETRIQDLSNLIYDFAETASAIAQLDLVISVDTAVAHLAGALGKPVWVLLVFNSEWRWMLDREDSPWYPTMRLFRQKQPGDWAEVFTRVKSALREFKIQF